MSNLTIRILFGLALVLAPVALTGCDSSKPSTTTPPAGAPNPEVSPGGARDAAKK